MSNGIEITTLGKLLIRHNEVVAENFISTKAILLFVYLAMHPGDHSRKKLAMMFWSETNDQQALKNLRTVLSSLRQKVTDAIIIERDAISINPEIPFQVDASQFEKGCIAAFSAPGTLDILTHMRALAELYQGGFLADVSFRDAATLTEWISEKQRQLHEIYTRLLYEIVDLAVKQIDYETGLLYSRRLVSLDPYWDEAQRQFMRLLAYTNRANEALLHYEDFSRLLTSELDALPEDETTALYEQIRSQQIRPPQREARSSIVLPDTPFVESVDDITLAQRMLNTTQCHLLTIYGISGIGKTALATQIAFHRRHLYRDGAYFIALKRTQSARDLPYIIANTLEIDFSNQTDPHQLEEIVLENLKNRHTLLVLDNYEYLLPETIFVQKILEQAAQVQVIITSQAPLNLFREWLMPLKGLRVPSLDDLHPETYESVRLFELTAQRLNPRFDLHENLAGVVEICNLIDGLPLALVIAASWTQILPIQKIIDYIIEGQEFNLPLQQNLPQRHQSLEMMLEYTWNTLTDHEQYALTALSIFNTAFNMDEVQQICEVDIGVLTSLIQKSLVQRYDDRYRMHQLVWRYARKKLLYSNQREALGMRYMDYVLRVLREIQQQKPLIHEYLLAIEVQYSNIWNYDWMAKSFQIHYILAISQFLMIYWEISRTDAVPAIRDILAAVHQADLPADKRFLLNLQLAQLCAIATDQEQARHFVLEALHNDLLNTQWHDLSLIFNLYGVLLNPKTRFQGDEALENDFIIARTAQNKLVSLYLAMHDYEQVINLFRHLLQSTDQPLENATMLAVCGAIAAENGDYPTARAHFTDALHHLANLDEPLLTSALNSLLSRVNNKSDLNQQVS